MNLIFNFNRYINSQIKTSCCFLFLFLSGCTGYNDKFDCKLENGATCKTMNQVNESVIEEKDEDYVSSEIYNNKNKVDLKRGINKPININIKKGDMAFSNIDAIPNKVLKIWVSGYVLESGDYIDNHYIYVVLQDSGWKIDQYVRKNNARVVG